ncbi:MAG TPA: RidA family protein [Rubrivivax sp.]|nr:RidA family protein [Rubrivivax sp.]
MKPARTTISSGGPWEEAVGYSRAVRVGSHVSVAGTTAATAQGIVGPGDPYAQAMQALRTIQAALEEAGATLQHVVRTRMFVTDIAHWPEVGRAHAEFFAAVRPAATLVEVSRLVDPALLVEIEADAIVPDPPAAPDPDPGDGHDPARAQRARSSPHGRTGARPRRRCGILHRVSTKGPAPSGPER